MTKIGRGLVAAVLFGIMIIAASGCQKKEGPMEKGGKAIDNAADKAGQQIDKAVEKTGDTIEKTGDKIKESVK